MKIDLFDFLRFLKTLREQKCLSQCKKTLIHVYESAR